MVATATSGLINRTDIDQCIQEECAWWVKASGSCAMEAIPRIIGFLGSELKGIKDKPQRRPGR